MRATLLAVWLVAVCLMGSALALGLTRAAVSNAVPTSPHHSMAHDAAAEEEDAAEFDQEETDAEEAEEAPVVASGHLEVDEFARVQDMMHALESEVDEHFEGSDLALVELHTRVSKARAAAADVRTVLHQQTTEQAAEQLYQHLLHLSDAADAEEEAEETVMAESEAEAKPTRAVARGPAPKPAAAKPLKATKPAAAAAAAKKAVASKKPVSTRIQSLKTASRAISPLKTDNEVGDAWSPLVGSSHSAAAHAYEHALARAHHDIAHRAHNAAAAHHHSHHTEGGDLHDHFHDVVHHGHGGDAAERDALDFFHRFSAHDADPHERRADWVSPQLVERGTLLNYLQTTENAIRASGALFTNYRNALDQLINKVRVYKPNVSRWVLQQKDKAVETVANVKTTLQHLMPELTTFENVYTDALAKEKYYRKQTQRLQAERMLQMSPPMTQAVEQATMATDKYTKALEVLRHYSEQAAKVRADAETALTNKKATLAQAKAWLAGSHDKLVSWLEGQHKHLKTVLGQAKELGVDWRHKLMQFRQVHSSATRLARQYQLALQRLNLEETLRRYRLAWTKYAHQHHPDEYVNYDLSVKFGALQNDLRGIAMKQEFHGSPPPPPETWNSILSQDSAPHINVPLDAPPLAELSAPGKEPMNAPFSFVPTGLLAPPSPPAALFKEPSKDKKKDKAAKGGDDAEAEASGGFLETAAHGHEQEHNTAQAMPPPPSHRRTYSASSLPAEYLVTAMSGLDPKLSVNLFASPTSSAPLPPPQAGAAAAPHQHGAAFGLEAPRFELPTGLSTPPPTVPSRNPRAPSLESLPPPPFPSFDAETDL